MIGKEEIIRIRCAAGGQLVGSRPKSDKHKQNIKKVWTEEKRESARISTIERMKNGYYNFLDSKFQRQVQFERMLKNEHPFQKQWKDNTHPSQTIRTCPRCGFTGKGGVMKRWHFDKCKMGVKYMVNV